MNIPPLPLVDGHLFVDNSFLEQLQTCPAQILYGQLYKRISTFEKPALSFGQIGHSVLEYRYRHCNNNQPDILDEEEQRKLLVEHFAENPPPEDNHRTLNWASELFITRYNERYPLEPFNILESEDG